ncbi:MAG: nitroreductase family protein, partial [Chloroflexi bacterium]|nr:nitroreductase family protein [Chloroflexota bacterium]
GDELDQIRQAFVDKSGDKPNPDLPGPSEYPEPYASRQLGLRAEVTRLTGPRRTDPDKRWSWQLRGLRLYEAPAVVYVYTDRAFFFQHDGLNVWPAFDCGLVSENIMLLATKSGLGTSAQAQAVHHPAILRKVLRHPRLQTHTCGDSHRLSGHGRPHERDPFSPRPAGKRSQVVRV